MSSPTGEVYRVDWLPGTDVLHGTCHCGAEHAAQDPVEMWEWMLAHPEGHRPPGPGGTGASTENSGNPGSNAGDTVDEDNGSAA
ncbi:hypothetical protein BM536_007745 [Streptomyces phaeoluteigriseus]|uniref:Uncharacterized protein n=1 Tax=Streptomyces phaeoluteigriseus TaxID=114686 RepID=A0A1V6MUT0_9ACTN|nr:hypothetical protein [Streptomyces phaeoluteigriseus]OQD56208.1 hypothetical protein BM536_007745 [Streptomyces phaeoluteigriseus]